MSLNYIDSALQPDQNTMGLPTSMYGVGQNIGQGINQGVNNFMNAETHSQEMRQQAAQLAQMLQNTSQNATDFGQAQGLRALDQQRQDVIAARNAGNSSQEVSLANQIPSLVDKAYGTNNAGTYRPIVGMPVGATQSTPATPMGPTQDGSAMGMPALPTVAAHTDYSNGQTQNAVGALMGPPSMITAKNGEQVIRYTPFTGQHDLVVDNQTHLDQAQQIQAKADQNTNRLGVAGIRAAAETGAAGIGAASRERVASLMSTAEGQRLATTIASSHNLDAAKYESLIDQSAKNLAGVPRAGDTADAYSAHLAEVRGALMQANPFRPGAGPAPVVSAGVQQYMPLIRKYAAIYKIDPAIAAIVMDKESGGRFDASNVNKNKDGSINSTDTGLMQVNSIHGFTPAQLLDPEFNIKTGIGILAASLKAHPGDLAGGAAAYNGSGAEARAYGADVASRYHTSPLAADVGSVVAKGHFAPPKAAKPVPGAAAAALNQQMLDFAKTLKPRGGVAQVPQSVATPAPSLVPSDPTARYDQ